VNRQYEIAKARKERELREDAATIAYHYPQYSLKDADNLPTGDQALLLGYIELNRYQGMLDGLNVATASQSKKGYKSMSSKLLRIIKRQASRL